MKKIILGLFIMLLSVGLVSCNYIESDKEGKRVSIVHTVSKFHEMNGTNKVYMRKDVTEEFLINPKRVVTFNLGVADVFSYFGLEELGIEKFGLPKNNLPKSLEVFKNKDIINAGEDLKTPNFNTLDLFNADLIILDGRTSEFYEDMKTRYPKTDILDLSLTTYDYNQHKKNYEVIGKIFPETKQFLEEEIIKYNQEFAEIKEKTNNVVAMFVQLNGKAISVSTGESGRYGLLYNEFGFKVPAFTTIENENSHGTMPAGMEIFTKYDPDVIFVMDRNIIVEGVLSDDIFNDPFFSDNIISAKLNGNIYNLDPTSWYTVMGGIKATNQMISDIKQFTNK